jgi:hypothetical protein
LRWITRNGHQKRRKDAALVLLVEHIQRRLNNPQFGSIMVGGTIGAADGDENSDPLVDASSS